MLKLFRLTLVGLIIFTVSFQIFAVLKGKGEVKGEVMSSWMSGEKIGFRLNITNQDNWSGPRLGSPNNFIYDGSDKLQVTEGDRVTVVYNSSDGGEIVAEKLEFVDNRPGEIDQTSYLFPILMTLGILAVILTVIYFIRRKQRELHTT